MNPERQLYARVRIDSLQDHADDVYGLHARARGNIAMRGALSAASFVAAIGWAWVGIEPLAMGFFGSSLWLGRRAVLDHRQVVNPLTSELKRVTADAVRTAHEAQITVPFRVGDFQIQIGPQKEELNP
jgi:hypothetical protein